MVSRELMIEAAIHGYISPEEADKLTEALKSCLSELAFYNPKRADEIADKAGIKRQDPSKAATHQFMPHPKYPWFCGECGYPEHEKLKHH